MPDPLPANVYIANPGPYPFPLFLKDGKKQGLTPIPHAEKVGVKPLSSTELFFLTLLSVKLSAVLSPVKDAY
jgi:hypothetical protein